jgi:hypothetical protein
MSWNQFRDPDEDSRIRGILSAPQNAAYVMAVSMLIYSLRRLEEKHWNEESWTEEEGMWPQEFCLGE